MTHRFSPRRAAPRVAVSASLLALAACEPGTGSDGPGAGGSAGEVTGPDEAPDNGVHVTSDRSFIFADRGETAQLDARVYRDGAPATDAELRFSSSDPDVVSVDRDGALEAVADAGSAVITIDADGVSPTVANAVIADLSPAARRVPSDQIVDVEPASAVATLRIDGDEPVAAGDILITGDRAGLFARVTDVWVQADGTYEIAYDTDVAATEAFENLELRAHTESMVHRPGPDAEFLDELTCVDDQHGLIEFSGPEFAPIIETALHVDYQIRSGRVAHAEVYLAGNLGLDARAGEVHIEGAFGGSFRCDVPLPDITLPAVPVLGPIFGVGGTISSRVGVQGEAEFDTGSMTLAGPEVEKEIESELGLRVASDEGIATIADVDVVRDEASHGEMTGQIGSGEVAFDAMPFLDATLTVRLSAGPIGVDVDLLDTTVGGGLEFAMSPPLSPYQAGYRGPKWELYVQGEADIHPLFDLGALLDYLRDWLGLSAGEEVLYGAEPMWQGRYPLAGSPAPKVVTDRDHVFLGEPVEVTASALGGYEGSVEHLLHRCGEGRAEVLGDVPAGKSVQFVPESHDDRGDHELTVLLWDSHFGRLGLPHAAPQPKGLTVGDDPQVCDAAGTAHAP